MSTQWELDAGIEPGGESVSAASLAEAALSPARASIAAGAPGDAFALLGPHRDATGAWRLHVLFPAALAVLRRDTAGHWRPMAAMGEGIFEAPIEGPVVSLLRVDWGGVQQEIEDVYAFGPVLDEDALAGIAAGDPNSIRVALGAHQAQQQGIDGVRFAVWAPNARRVSVVGDFNGWDGRRHPMRLRHGAGVWEIFLPRVEAGARYKFEITAADGTRLTHKADPMARQSELLPGTASVVADGAQRAWQDHAWMQARASMDDRAISIYEVHAGSWRRGDNGDVLDWDQLGDQLIPYVTGLGFTHIELLPVSEHPFGGSWGYQPLGLYAPTARHGGPDRFARFVDRCHQAGLGVIVDWVGAHFPSDAHGMQRFDGTALYEHDDPRQGLHPDWDTLIYNFGRSEVTGFLIGSALEWIERFHIDGLRVDAVASMLYRDYSREDGQWIPNAHGGRENLEAIAFLRDLNDAVARQARGVLVIAEESTAWPGVTAPSGEGGLGFTHKWNMGWMHDTLSYLGRDPIHRSHHHSQMTFSAMYAFSEQFVLPLSHDEVVHGKGSLLGKMPGDRWQQLANLRAYLGFMWAHPGSKLLFMGGEFAQCTEWNHDAQLDWAQASEPAHAGVARMIGDLNRLLRELPALQHGNRTEQGFEWSVGDDHVNSVLAFIRHDPRGSAGPLLAVSNFTPMARHGYRVGVPHAGRWQEVFNSDSRFYGGSDIGNHGQVDTLPIAMHGHAQSLALTLPPLSTVFLQVEG
ncbi:1,4-alpha-glucan branching protein GlgB [Stenotrophomonas bentonitica]